MPHKARDTYCVGLSCSLLLSLLLGIFLWQQIDWISRLFHCDSRTAQIASDMIPAAVAYFIFYCFNSYNFELQNAKEETTTANVVAFISRWGIGVGAMIVATFKEE